MGHRLEPFFSPAGVVLVGATGDSAKLGYGVARNLAQGRFGGAVHYVNPAGGELFGRPVHRSLATVPDPVDLAVLLVPAAAVPDSLRACGERGIGSVVVESGGFRESGPEGSLLEDRCTTIARRFGIRMLGPNCMGTMDTHTGLDTTFLQPPGPVPGEVAFISHSGAICAAVIDWAAGRGFGISRLASLGNQADVTETEVLSVVAGDPHTRVVTLYLEGVADGRRLVEIASRIDKPVIALKVGRSAAGGRAVTSHTGALAGRGAAYSAAFRRAGIIEARTVEEMFDWAQALAWAPLPAGPGIAVLTNAGGPGVAAADALEAAGVGLAEISDQTRSRLAGMLPAAASLANPIDMLASASPERFAGCLAVLLDDPGVDGVLVVFPPPPMFPAEDVAGALVPVVDSSSKPVLVTLMGERSVGRAAAVLRAARIPDYPFPERAAGAFTTLAGRAGRRVRAVAAPLEGLKAGRVREILARARPGEWLPSGAVAEILTAYGIAVPAWRPADGVEAAVAAAERIGYPVALKVDSADLPHKSDVGGVRLGLADPGAVRAAYPALVGAVEAALPKARVRGVQVQAMADPGQDVILGSTSDPQFGPLVMFGSGGIEVEGLEDVGFALAPLTDADVGYLLESTWAGRRLTGYRSLPAADRGMVEQVLVRLAQLACDHPGIAEVEVNPLRVYAPGRGAVAVDARIKVTEAA